MKIAMLIPDNRDEFRDWENPEPRFGPAPRALLDGFAQMEGCEIHVVCCVHRPVHSPEKIANNISYHSLVVPRWGWRLAYAGCVWALRQKLRALRPDIVHGQGTERYCALAAALSGFPNLITVHGNMRAVSRALGAKFLSMHWLAAHLETFSLKRTNGVVCLTSYTREQVGDLNDRTWIVPNAVDRIFSDVVRAPDVTPLILCAADINVYKNQLRLLEAFDEIARTREVRLGLAGTVLSGAAYGEEVLQRCRERAWCSYEGLLQSPALRELLSRATALVLPSLEDNCPMVILEAMSAGVPVAAAAIGGIPDLIENQVSGLLFDPRDANSIRAALETLLDEPAKAEKISLIAKERARGRFAPEIVARRHLEIYREVLNESHIRD